MKFKYSTLLILIKPIIYLIITMSVWAPYFKRDQEQLSALVAVGEELGLMRRRIDELERSILVERQRIAKAKRQARKDGGEEPSYDKLNKLISRTESKSETFLQPLTFSKPPTWETTTFKSIEYFMQDNEAIKSNDGHCVSITVVNRHKQTSCSETFIESGKKNIVLMNRGITELEISNSSALSATHIDLRNNKLSTIPQCILQMPNLKKLYVSGNKMQIASGTMVHGVSSFEIIN